MVLVVLVALVVLAVLVLLLVLLVVLLVLVVCGVWCVVCGVWCVVCAVPFSLFLCTNSRSSTSEVAFLIGAIGSGRPTYFLFVQTPDQPLQRSLY